MGLIFLQVPILFIIIALIESLSKARANIVSMDPKKVFRIQECPKNAFGIEDLDFIHNIQVDLERLRLKPPKYVYNKETL